MPARVEVRDFVARRFQLRFQIENLRARFRIKIRCGKHGFQIGDFVFRRQNIRFHRFPFALFFPFEFARFFFGFRWRRGNCGRGGS